MASEEENYVPTWLSHISLVPRKAMLRLFRHGDRTPTDFYPNDPYQDPVFWPEGIGSLTTKGKQELYTLGKWLRRRYHHLLPNLYSPDDLYLFSSDADRCLMSAQLCLAGLYPPAGFQVWEPNLLWQPLPVHTTPRSQDQLIIVGKKCPRYDLELETVRNSTTPTPEEEQLYQYLTLHTGQSITDILAAEFLYNTLEIEDKHGFRLPDWTNAAYPQPLREMATRSLAIFTQTTTLKRLKGGPLLKDVISHMSAKENNTLSPDRRLFLYSGHDTTLVNVMRTMGVVDLLKPDMAAALLIELHQDPEPGKQHYLEVYYLNNTQTTEVTRLEIPGCPRPCYLDGFISITKPFIPDDWDQECYT